MVRDDWMRHCGSFGALEIDEATLDLIIPVLQ
jgi:hypothetical protein